MTTICVNLPLIFGMIVQPGPAPPSLYESIVSRLSLSFVADLLSILGFLLTLYVSYAVRNIKSYYVFKARVPELIRQISTSASQLAALHADFENCREKVRLELARTEATLDSLKKKVNREINAQIKSILTQSKEYKANKQYKEHLWEIYIDLQKLIEKVRNMQADREWESHNG